MYKSSASVRGVNTSSLWSAQVMLIAMRRAALAAHEYLITVEDEVRIVWKHRPTFASLLLLSIRWVTVASAILTFIPVNSKVSQTL